MVNPTTTDDPRPIRPDNSPPPPQPAPAPAAIPRRTIAILLLPLVLYVAALNPYFPPGNYDDLVYYSGAVSLADELSFKDEGRYIVDWPPGLSALVAIPFALGLESLWTAKILILFAAAAGLIAGWTLHRREGRPAPLVTFVLFALLPISFMMGTRLMTEWPYFFISALFLLALSRLRQHGWHTALVVLAGSLLATATLTRFVGVLLGAAVLAQAIEKLVATRRWRAILPEVVTAGIGAAGFLLWKAKLYRQIQAGTAAETMYYSDGITPDMIVQFEPLTLLPRITDLFFHTNSALAAQGWEGPLATLACAVPGAIVMLGLVARLASRKRSPTDWYVVAMLALVARLGDDQQTRYLMPIAPFLIGYGFAGGRKLFHWARPGVIPRFGLLARLGVVAWMLLLVAGTTHLLLIGNAKGTHGALCYFVSPTPAQFYRGEWLDLYQACQHVRDHATPGKLALIGDDDRYFARFAGRPRVPLGPDAEFAFLLVRPAIGVGHGLLANLDLEPVYLSQSLQLYLNRRAGAGPDDAAPPVKSD